MLSTYITLINPIKMMMSTSGGSDLLNDHTNVVAADNIYIYIYTI